MAVKEKIYSKEELEIIKKNKLEREILVYTIFVTGLIAIALIEWYFKGA